MKFAHGARVTAASAAAVVVALTLVACAPADLDITDRAAAGESLKGSQLCIVNDSTLTLDVTWRGEPTASQILVGETLCRGAFETERADVFGVIQPMVASGSAPGLPITVMAHNHFLMTPIAIAVTDFARNSGWGACASFDVGTTSHMTSDLLHGVLTRVEDSEKYKELVFTLTDEVGEPKGKQCQFRF